MAYGIVATFVIIALVIAFLLDKSFKRKWAKMSLRERTDFCHMLKVYE